MIDPLGMLAVHQQLNPKIIELVHAFVSPEGVGRRYLLGRNEHSEALSRAINIDGFVDDFADPGTVWNDKIVVKGSEVPNNGIIVNCSMSISPISAHRRIESLEIAGVIAYSDLCNVYPKRFELPNFVLKTREDVRQNHSKWKILSESLADDESRKVLENLLRYRLTADYSSMQSYTVRLREQYFEDFLNVTAGEVFVDAGGFDGDTTEEFCKRYPDYKKIYIFEPSVTNISNARKRLNGFREIELIQKGLSNSAGTLWFNPDAGSASSVTESGTIEIDVTTLDQCVNEKVTLIKMDLEGWELQALEGCRGHIVEDYPKLAISVYHDPSDFWSVFEYVLSVRKAYKVFLRHYTEGWSETVMYFRPVLDA
jgi:FkbM family methyltransferase